MKCQEIVEKLNDYLEGNLAAQPVQEIEEHLSRCSSCQKLFAALKEVRTSLQKMPQLTVPPSLAEKLYQLPTRKKSRWLPWRAFTAYPFPQQLAATLASLLLAVSFYTLMPNKNVLARFIDQQFHLGYHRISRLVTKAEFITVNLEKVGESLTLPLQALKEEGKED
jgi:anti-sigma factor RsiW